MGHVCHLLQCSQKTQLFIALFKWLLSIFFTGTCILCFTDTYEKQLEGGDVGEDFSDTDIDFAR